MSELKRKRARAIIIKDGKIISMYRELNDRIFYTFPGGGQEGEETLEECVKREVFEEFGLTVEPIKKIYIYENERSIEHFYLCEWINGEFATGQGEEYDENRNNGVYIPMMIEISSIPRLPLMPSEVATSFYEDYSKDNKNIRDEIKYINIE